MSLSIIFCLCTHVVYLTFGLSIVLGQDLFGFVLVFICLFVKWPAAEAFLVTLWINSKCFGYSTYSDWRAHALMVNPAAFSQETEPGSEPHCQCDVLARTWTWSILDLTHCWGCRCRCRWLWLWLWLWSGERKGNPTASRHRWQNPLQLGNYVTAASCENQSSSWPKPKSPELGSDRIGGGFGLRSSAWPFGGI